MLKATKIIAVWCLWSATSLVAESTPEIRLVGSNQPKAVEVVGLSKEHLADFSALSEPDERWTKVLAIYVVDRTVAEQSIAGSYSVDGTTLRFTPRYVFRPGLKYRVVFRPFGLAGSNVEMAKDFSIPAPAPAAPTRVTTIYPSADQLPENHLRFYIHFSAPMSAGEAYGHVKLLRADGTPVARAFLEIGEELWDPAGQRLTLLFDPGRVKKGLQPREEFGPVLQAGQSYRLVIDKAWRDANGQPLTAGFEKRFTAGPAVETAIDSKQWQLSPPASGTRESLVIRFPRPLDRALLMRMINVVDVTSKEVVGEITLGEDERRWEFRPDQPWAAGTLNLVVDTTLEDPAGNNLARPFEVDVFEKVDKTSAPELMRIPISIRQAAR